MPNYIILNNRGRERPTSGALAPLAQRSSHSHRHAVAGLAARDLWAWCSSFFSWLPPSHGLAQACLHQGGTLRCAAIACTSAVEKILTRACLAFLARLWDASSQLIGKSIHLIWKLLVTLPKFGKILCCTKIFVVILSK